MDWLLTLTSAGLPATDAWVDERGNIQAQFSRELTPAEWLAFLRLTDPERARREGARDEARLAAALRNCTAAQAVEYINSSVTDLASAKAVLRLMARLIVALRDATWPDLGGEA